MSSTFEYVEVVGTSTSSIEEALTNAVSHVAKSKPVNWFEVLSVRGRVLPDSKALEYQVTVKCACKG